MNSCSVMMSYVVLCTVTILLVLSSTVYCDRMNWLMQGEILKHEDIPSNINLDTSKIHFPVFTNTDVVYNTKKNKIITGIIAAATHMRGWVSIIDGGLNSQSVKLRYKTQDGQNDVLFIMVQSANNELPMINGNVVENSRYSIVYEPVRNWTLEDTRKTV